VSRGHFVARAVALRENIADPGQRVAVAVALLAALRASSPIFSTTTFIAAAVGEWPTGSVSYRTSLLRGVQGPRVPGFRIARWLRAERPGVVGSCLRMFRSASARHRRRSYAGHSNHSSTSTPRWSSQAACHGAKATRCSLRHTCIMYRLLYGNGADLPTLARNVRTSPEMIDRCYASLLERETNVGLLHGSHRVRR
jgi:hypothetical protein